MQETKDTKPNETAEGASHGEDSEATSSETLSDLEEKEKVSDSKHEGEASPAPSPDGAFDENRERDDAGPM